MKKEGKGKFPGTEGKQVNRRILIWKHIHPNINMYKYHFLFLIWLNEQLLTIFLLLKRNYVTLEPCLNMLFNVRLKLKLVWQQNPKLLSGVTIGKEVQGRSHEWGGKKFSDLLTSPFFIGLCPTSHFTRKASVDYVPRSVDLLCEASTLTAHHGLGSWKSRF